MTKAGVGPRWAPRTHAAVHTPEHELVAQQRQQFLQRLVGAGSRKSSSSASSRRDWPSAFRSARARGSRRSGSAGRAAAITAGCWRRYSTSRSRRNRNGPRPKTRRTRHGHRAGRRETGRSNTAEAAGIREPRGCRKVAKETFPMPTSRSRRSRSNRGRSSPTRCTRSSSNIPALPTDSRRSAPRSARGDDRLVQAGSGEYLHFNPTHWNNLPGLDKALKDGVASEYHPLGVEHAGPQYYVTHEMGHLLDGYLKAAEPAKWKNLMGSFSDPARPSTFYDQEWQLRATVRVRLRGHEAGRGFRRNLRGRAAPNAGQYNRRQVQGHPETMIVVPPVCIHCAHYGRSAPVACRPRSRSGSRM